MNKLYWPYRARVKANTVVEETALNDWCAENIGERHHEWYSYYAADIEVVDYVFKDQESLVLFKLKWECKNGN